MFDTAHKTSARFGRPAKLVLTAVAAFTLLTGGAALADDSTSSGTHDSQAPAAQSLLQPHNLLITEIETVDAEDAAEAADGAQGVHGACVSKAAQDKSTVGRDHGLAVSKAAHTCAKGSGKVASNAKGAAKSAAGKAKGAAKSVAGKAHGKS